ncbi:MAG TPA: DUF5985 family protein [Gemmatimonadales bacterium]|nr:DUF5985 family protein [Gemmatimonadales bacterium]
MAPFVYVLCALTSFACAALLLRGWRTRGVGLLFWSGLGFVGFALGNIMLVVDVLVLPSYDLALLRSVPILAGLAVMLYGLIWETR